MRQQAEMGRRSAVALLSGTLIAGSVWARDRWPTRPVRLVISSPAGSAPDTVARLVGDVIARSSGQPVVVDNRPGASGVLGAEAVMREKPDGYTLLLAINSFATLTPHVQKLTFDPLVDLTPVVETTRNTLVLTGNPTVPARNFADLVAWVKANPGKISYASYSPASVSHLGGLLLNDLAGLDLNHVGYKGTSQGQADVLGGHIPLMFDSFTSAMPAVRDGRLRAFAVNSPRRLDLAPNVPTFRELGFAELEILAAWVAVFGPKNMSSETTSQIAEAFAAALRDEAVSSKIRQSGFSAPKTSSPAQLKAELAAESRALAAFVAKKNITMTP